MGKTICLTALFLFLTTSAAMVLRCGTRVVEIGDTKLQVLAYCGEPDSKDIERIRTVKRRKGRSKVESTEIVEVWTYNYGPTRFMRQLYFSGSRLIRVEELEKGF